MKNKQMNACPPILMRQRCRTVLFVFVILFIFLSKVVAGGGVMWQEGGVPVGSSISYTFGRHVIVSDMKGGAIVGWSEGRDPHNGVYAQRVDSSGNVLWQDNGTPVCTTGFFFDPYNLCAVSDGYGGAIFVWEDMRYEYDLYAQRIDSSGNVLWNPAGVPVCDYDSVQAYPSIVSDGNGGCCVAWLDGRYGYYSNVCIYSQRLGPGGNRLWNPNGVEISSKPGIYGWFPSIASDGQEGEIITWSDKRYGDYDSFAQRVNSAGILQWGVNGIEIYVGDSAQYAPQIIKDFSIGNDKLIISWTDGRNGDWDIYAQRVDLNGNILWTIEGNPICVFNSDQPGAFIISDYKKGALIIWRDYRNSNWDVFSQRVDSSGALLWDSVGVAVCEADSDQGYCSMVTDEQSGAIIAWKDERGFYDGIYVQHIDSSGICLWDSNGMFISSNTADAGLPVIVEDGVEGAIIAWSDGRPKGIYAQRVGDVVGIQEKRDHRQKSEGQRILLYYPNPFTTAFSVKCSRISEEQKINLEIYNVSGRLLKSVPLTTNHLSLGADLLPGIYFLKADGKYVGKVVKVK